MMLEVVSKVLENMLGKWKVNYMKYKTNNISNKGWKRLDSEIVLNNEWYKIRKDKVQLPSGVIIDDYYVSELQNVSMVFAMTHDKKVIFVKQYRHPVKGVLLELPAGIYSKGELPIDVARQELLEETGYKAKKLISLGKIVEYPTKDSHEMHLYLAKDAVPTKFSHPEETEDIEVVLIPINELLKMIENSQIFVSGTISCVIKALINLKIITL